MLRFQVVRLVTSAGALLALFASAACSSDPPAGGCKEFAPAGDMNTPTASFKDHVYPIFRQSCGLSSSCHGAPTTSKGNLYLGSATETNIAQVRSGLMGKKAEAIDMNLIAPGDPKNSYLMRKMDGDQCALKCKTGDCGRVMPDGSDPLPEEKRLTIRRWIVQGAKDN
jgi:hypothetical protein